MTEMEVRAVGGTASDVDEPVDGAKRFDQLCVRRPFIIVRPVLRQRRTWPRTSMSIAPVLASRHGAGLRPATVCRPRFFRVLPHIARCGLPRWRRRPLEDRRCVVAFSGVARRAPPANCGATTSRWREHARQARRPWRPVRPRHRWPHCASRVEVEPPGISTRLDTIICWGGVLRAPTSLTLGCGRLRHSRRTPPIAVELAAVSSEAMVCALPGWRRGERW